MADSPGGQEVGRVAIRVMPDTSRFSKELRAKLESIERKEEVHIRAKLDTTRLESQLKALTSKIATSVGNIKLTKPVTEVVKQTRAASIEAASVRSHWRVTREHLLVVARSLRDITVSAKAFGTEVRRIGRDSAGIGRTFRRLRQSFARFISNAGDSLGDGLSSAFSALAAGAKGAATAMAASASSGVGLAAVAALVVVAVETLAGTLLATAGAMGAAFAGLPVVVAGLLGPVAAVAVGFDGIKKAASALSGQLDHLKATVSATFERSLAPAVSKVGKTFPILERGLSKVALAMSAVADQFATVLSSERGMVNLGNAFSGIATLVKRASIGLRNFFETMLEIAGNTGLYKILGETISGVFIRISSWMRRIESDGRLTTALTKVRDLLFAITDAIIGFVDNGLTFFNASAGGFTSFLNSLTKFFGRFDWETLGAAFGRVFQALGDWLKNTNQGLIDTLTDSIVAVADAFTALAKSGALDLLTGMFMAFNYAIAGVVYAFAGLIHGIKQVGEFLYDFGASAANAIGRLRDNVRTGIIQVAAWFGRLGQLPGKVAAWFGRAKDAGIAKLSQFVSWVRRFPDAIRGALGDFGSLLWSAGGDLVSGLWQGIKSATGWLWSQLRGWAQGIVDSVLSSFGINSPSKVFKEQVGKWLPLGLAEGIEDATPEAVKAAQKMANKVSEIDVGQFTHGVEFSPIESRLELAMSGIEDRIVNGLSHLLEAWTVEIDGNGMAKMVNKANLRKSRR